MPTYRDLGPTLTVTAVPDAQGMNPYGLGFWTLAATQRELNTTVAQAEIYQISIDGPIGSSFKMYRNTRQWNNVLQGWLNYNDPTEPLYVRPSDSIYLYWNSTRTPVPTAVFWLRYDADLPENQSGAI